MGGALPHRILARSVATSLFVVRHSGCFFFGSPTDSPDAGALVPGEQRMSSIDNELEEVPSRRVDYATVTNESR